MGLRIQLVAIVVAGGLFFIVFELVRRKRLLERYALLWLGSTVVLLGLAVWKDLLVTRLDRGGDLLRAVGAVRGDARVRPHAAAALLAGHLAPGRPEQGAGPEAQPPAAARRGPRERRGRDRRALGAHLARPRSARCPELAGSGRRHRRPRQRRRTARHVGRPAAPAAARTTRSWSSTVRRATTRLRWRASRSTGAGRCSSRARTSGSPAAATRAPRRRPRRCSSC